VGLNFCWAAHHFFGAGSLNQLALKMGIFSAGCLRQPAQKKSYFWYRLELLPVTLKKLGIIINYFSSTDVSYAPYRRKKSLGTSDMEQWLQNFV
jgi:hypothetical protein